MGQGTRDRNGTGRGTRDEGRSKKWEGEASAEPKRQRFANSDWRMVKRQIFWRAVLLHCRKFSAHQEMCPPALPKIFSAHQEMRPPIFSACFSRLRFGRHRLQSVDKMGGRGSCRAETAAICEWRLANGETANFLEGSAPALPKKFA